SHDYEGTPCSMPTRNIFSWQKPCYLLGEGYTKTFKELMETTDWDSYGTGKYEKCANCMAHCGYEPTAANAALANPLKAMWVALRGVRVKGPMAPEIDLGKQRPEQYIFAEPVQKKLSGIARDEAVRPPHEASTAAPVSRRSAALQARAAITWSTPARPPRTTRRRRNAMLAISSSLSDRPASQRASPARTSVATTTSPDFSAGSSPPATPKLMTP